MSELKVDFPEQIKEIFEHHQVSPTLVDVGASGHPPEIWNVIAPYSNYIGFDPDRREVHESHSGAYQRNVIINKAITPDPQTDEVEFFLTKSPYCSSTLIPDLESLENYHYTDLFRVEDKKSVPASLLEKLLNEIQVSQADWIKTDSQGIDLQIYQSLSPQFRDQILAIDIEPGLLDAYQEEDLFPEAHTKFSSEGFWLSDITVKGPVRINQRSLTKLKEINPEYSLMYIGRNLKKCPGWVEARYLRTISHLESINSPARNYVLLWVFSMLDQQYGYCLDIASAYKDKFGDDHTFNVLWNTAFDHLPIPEPKSVKQESFFKKVKSKIARRIKE